METVSTRVSMETPENAETFSPETRSAPRFFGKVRFRNAILSLPRGENLETRMETRGHFSRLRAWPGKRKGMHHRRRFKLHHGVRVTFSFSSPQTGVQCEWDPAIPRFTSNSAARKFEKAYRAARDSFFEDVAQLIGGAVLNVDVDAAGRLERMTEYVPKATH
jgi:hypothetical protein